MHIEFLENLLNQISVSGSEENGQRVLREHMEQYADEIRTDEIGDVICVLNPESPVRIMLSAHADEIGLVVTRITEEGRIQAIERGGIMTHNYPGQKVQICTKKGIVYGVVECSRELLKKETVKAADLLIDIGAVSKEDALQHVSLGDTVVLDSGIRNLLHNRITARALDDRIGYLLSWRLLNVQEKKDVVQVFMPLPQWGKKQRKMVHFGVVRRLIRHLQ